ncbi:MAG: hypothetical protein ACI8TS_002214, partial [Flavobacteriales bacterium]
CLVFALRNGIRGLSILYLNRHMGEILTVLTIRTGIEISYLRCLQSN